MYEGMGNFATRSKQEVLNLLKIVPKCWSIKRESRYGW
jgi:hypothetical protein